MRRAVAIMALGTSAVFASDAHAQRLDRTKRPLVGDPAPFAFPEMQARMLSNGLRVVVIENHALPLVSVRAAVAVDSIDDPVGKEGLFVLTAGLLREARTNGEVALDPDKPAQRVRCNIEQFQFSAHATREALIDYAKKLAPGKIVLVHGDLPAVEWMRATLSAALPQSEIIVPAPEIELEL